MSNTKATKEEQEKLIELVEKQRILWDPRSRNHANRRVLHTCWEEIGGAVGLSGQEASRMWRILRHEFKKQLDIVKAKASAGSSSEPFRSTFPHFDKLLFLSEEERNQEAESVPPLICISDDSENDESLAQKEETSSPPPPVVTAAVPVKRTRPPNEDTEKSKVRRGDDSKIGLSGCYVDDDDAICFFNSLLPHVRNLPLEKKFQFRLETQKTLYDLTFSTADRNFEDQQPTTSGQTDANI